MTNHVERDGAVAPELTVLVPAYQGGAVLHRCLAALRESDLEAEAWELIVADDGSTDDTAEVAARWADAVVRVDDGPRGPANARNAGARHARGSVLVFIDADVLVHRDTLRRFRDLLRSEPDVVAAFGAYDDRPGDPGFVSQYRNLLHRYVHLRGAGDAETFWAGCGAVRTDAYRAVGGFDAARFPRPQIEDIELGYRLREAGWRIVLDPAIQATHLKRWTFRGMVRSDLMDRGVPWMRLLIRSGRPGSSRRASLNVRPLEKAKTALAGLGLAILGVGAGATAPAWLAVGGVLLAVLVCLNWPLYRWFAARRGWPFAVGVVPLSILYHVVGGTSVILAWAAELGGVAMQTAGLRSAEGSP